MSFYVVFIQFQLVHKSAEWMLNKAKSIKQWNLENTANTILRSIVFVGPSLIDSLRLAPKTIILLTSII